MPALEFVYKIIVMVLVLFILLSILNISYTEVVNNLRNRGKEEVDLYITDENLAGKVKICYDTEKIILDNVGFSYKEKAEYVPLFFFKGMTFSGKAGAEDVIKFDPQKPRPTVTIESVKFPNFKEIPKTCEQAGGTCGLCDEREEIKEFKTKCALPPTYSRRCCRVGDPVVREIPLAAMIYPGNPDTLLLGFMVRNEKCQSLAASGMNVQEFTKLCGNLVQRTFFLTGTVVNCATAPGTNPGTPGLRGAVSFDGAGYVGGMCETFFRVKNTGVVHWLESNNIALIVKCDDRTNPQTRVRALSTLPVGQVFTYRGGASALSTIYNLCPKTSEGFIELFSGCEPSDTGCSRASLLSTTSFDCKAIPRMLQFRGANDIGGGMCEVKYTITNKEGFAWEDSDRMKAMIDCVQENYAPASGFLNLASGASVADYGTTSHRACPKWNEDELKKDPALWAKYQNGWKIRLYRGCRDVQGCSGATEITVPEEFKC
ncbi:MAG: hypothetical protein HY518_00325 [Candidatus Aenigmarchaeota archaeon]|nr:hypothetical protein [Candidatus Aenigmarchaeota archaeon]